MRMPKYEWYQDAAGEYRWRLKAANGEVVASGEGYKTKGGALRGIDAHRRAAVTTRVVQAKV